MNGRQVRSSSRQSVKLYKHADVLIAQIKHAVGSARSIARENNQKLDMKHIESVLEVVEAWNDAKALK